MLTWRRLALATLPFLAVVLAGAPGDRAAYLAGGLYPLWPCDAIMLGLLVARSNDRIDQAAILAGGVAGSILYCLWGAVPPMAAALFSTGTVGAAIVGAALLRRFGVTRHMFDRVGDVAALVVSCGGGALVGATIGAIGLWLWHGTASHAAWIGWYAAALLSQLVVVPMIVIGAQLADRQHSHVLAGHSILELVALLGLTAGVTAAIFFWTRLPLLFLITPVVLVVTFRLRAFGAATAVAIVAIVSTYATASGHGPIARLEPDPASQAMMLCLFLTCCFLTALPSAALLSEREARTEEGRLLAERLKVVIENIGEVIYRIDADGRWVYLNPAWETLTGHAIDDTIGQPWTAHVAEEDRSDLPERIASVLSGRERSLRRTVRFATAAGPRWMELFIQTLDASGAPAGATGTLRDIDDRKRLEAHVMTAKRRAEQRAREATLLASTDELTGLANRRAFMRQLEREMAGAAEFNLPLSVAILDVDHFKLVNDRHGHAVGDRVLQSVATHAATIVRSGDLVGRLGGEEFGILMPGATADDALVISERLRRALEHPRDDEALPPVTVSIGIAAREDLRDPLMLLAGADAALYAAKGAGRNRVRTAA